MPPRCTRSFRAFSYRCSRTLSLRLVTNNTAENTAIAKAVADRLGGDASKLSPVLLPEPMSKALAKAGVQRVAPGIWVRRAQVVRGEKGRELTDGIALLIDLRISSRRPPSILSFRCLPKRRLSRWRRSHITTRRAKSPGLRSKR
jgi:hypothetical protein